jgi:short-chain fatty acids transporter
MQDNQVLISNKPPASSFVRLGIVVADWAERWFPDAFIFALLAVVIVFFAGLLLGTSSLDLAKDFGEGFWELIPFTMQMTMIIVGGYVVASSPPASRMIARLASIPRTPRGAIAFVTFLASISALLSWGFSLIFSGLLAREVVRKVPGVDYRAMGAGAYVGSVSVAVLGLTSSAAVLVANRDSIPATLLKISGLIPLTQTIFTWQNIVTVTLLIAVTVWVSYQSAPSAADARTAESLGVVFDPQVQTVETRRSPAEWLEYNGILTLLVSLIGFLYLIQVFYKKGPLAVLDLNTYNFLFIILGLLLHWRPRSFLKAVATSVPATASVLIQFPFYAGIFGIVTKSPISSALARFFVRISTPGSYPVVVSIYSAFLGLFLPSAGGKWAVEAPYILEAAKNLHVNLGWVVQIYSTSEALPLLVNPFFMLPLLGVLKVRAGELVGYSILQLMIHIPLVLFLMWFLTHTLPYVAPAP